MRFKTARADQIEAQERQLAATLSRKQKEFDQRARSAEAAQAVAENELVTTRRAIIDLQDRVERKQARPELRDRRRRSDLGQPGQRHGVDQSGLGRRAAAAGDVQRVTSSRSSATPAKATKKGSYRGHPQMLGDAHGRVHASPTTIARDPILPGRPGSTARCGMKAASSSTSRFTGLHRRGRRRLRATCNWPKDLVEAQRRLSSTPRPTDDGTCRPAR